MKLTIFGATGGIGGQLVAQAAAAGHDVTAVVRSQRQLPAPARVVVADLAAPDPAVLESAVRGADAVLSGLGARSAPDVGVASRGTRAIVEAMQAFKSGQRSSTVMDRLAKGFSDDEIKAIAAWYGAQKD